jgi:pimeloyl-ACP methyl ester carboxylesterase
VGERIEINGHPTWVDERGGGAETVLLLHGGMSNSDLMLDAWGDPLAERCRLVAFDRRDHGYTADTAAAFHYEDMATETIGVLEHVVEGRAHLVGWSDGGIVALAVAMSRPDLVDRLVVIGTNSHHDGVLPLELSEDSPVAAQVFQAYAARSPDGPDHFGDLFEKFLAMATTEPTWTVEDIAAVRCAFALRSPLSGSSGAPAPTAPAPSCESMPTRRSGRTRRTPLRPRGRAATGNMGGRRPA